MSFLWFKIRRNSILVISLKTSTGVVSQAKQRTVVLLRYYSTLQFSQGFNFSGICASRRLKGCCWHQKWYILTLILTKWAYDNSPCVPFHQAVLGVHQSLCHPVQTHSRGCQHNIADSSQQWFMKTIHILSFERLCHGMWYLGARLSGHSTGPVSSGTTLRDSRRKVYTYR